MYLKISLICQPRQNVTSNFFCKEKLNRDQKSKTYQGKKQNNTKKKIVKIVLKQSGPSSTYIKGENIPQPNTLYPNSTVPLQFLQVFCTALLTTKYSNYVFNGVLFKQLFFFLICEQIVYKHSLVGNFVCQFDAISTKSFQILLHQIFWPKYQKSQSSKVNFISLMNVLAKMLKNRTLKNLVVKYIDTNCEQIILEVGLRVWFQRG
eukprot:TRINITY_DN1741_c1_g2_i7.p4 TRINITY_DN1741_c1_g2~~TRINITY_DN1741_c1_g2_i7.p4  ORF type:complete len:206 (-),score=1.67 TRINITY_DN1741_c1_g2_i7:679-1296(-)